MIRHCGWPSRINRPRKYGRWYIWIGPYEIGYRQQDSHNLTAFNCRFWTGDRAGYNLEAICKECNDR